MFSKLVNLNVLYLDPLLQSQSNNFVVRLDYGTAESGFNKAQPQMNVCVRFHEDYLLCFQVTLLQNGVDLAPHIV